MSRRRPRPSKLASRQAASATGRWVVPEVQQPSGLFTPPTSPGIWTPGLGPQDPSGLAVGPGRGPGMDMVYCAPSPEDLDLGSIAFDELVETVSRLPFWPTMTTLRVLAAEVEHHPHDQVGQLLMARELFEVDVLRRIAGFLRADVTHLAFNARHIAALQRLVIFYAEDPPTPPAGVAWAHGIGDALLGVASALPHGDPPDGDDRQFDNEDWAAWARFTAVLSLWDDQPNEFEAFARAHALYVDAHRAPELAAESARCDLDLWMRKRYELTIGEQLAGGLAYAATAKALSDDATIEERRKPVGAVALADSALADKENKLRTLLSASRDEYRDLIAGDPDDLARIAWDHSVFEERPFLRGPDGELHLISPRAIAAWSTRGLHHRILRMAESRGKKASAGFLTYAGKLGEHATRTLIARSHKVQMEQRVVTVRGEHRYWVGKNGHDAPDVALLYGEDVVMVEVYSGRASREARTTLNPEKLQEFLDRATAGKLTELANRTREFLSGHLVYEEVDLQRVRRIWPVVVLAGDAIIQTPALWNYVRRFAPAAFIADARVRTPTILNLDDLEPLLALVEHDGALMSELLERIHGSEFAGLPARNWVHAQYGSIPARPTHIAEEGNRALRESARIMYPHSKQLRELEASSR